MPYHFINIPVNVCVRTSSATSIASVVEVDFDCNVGIVAMEDFWASVGSPFWFVVFVIIII